MKFTSVGALMSLLAVTPVWAASEDAPTTANVAPADRPTEVSLHRLLEVMQARKIVETMQQADAIRIVVREKLTQTLIEILRMKEDSRALGKRGRAVFQSQSGSTAQTAQAIVSLLKEGVGTAR